MSGTTVGISIPKLGLTVALVVWVPEGEQEKQRIETCARVVVAAMIRSAGLEG